MDMVYPTWGLFHLRWLILSQVKIEKKMKQMSRYPKLWWTLHQTFRHHQLSRIPRIWIFWANGLRLGHPIARRRTHEIDLAGHGLRGLCFLHFWLCRGKLDTLNKLKHSSKENFRSGSRRWDRRRSTGRSLLWHYLSRDDNIGYECGADKVLLGCKRSLPRLQTQVRDILRGRVSQRNRRHQVPQLSKLLSRVEDMRLQNHSTSGRSHKANRQFYRHWAKWILRLWLLGCSRWAQRKCDSVGQVVWEERHHAFGPFLL